MRDDAAIRIEISLRAAMLARAVLDLVNMEPTLAELQMRDVIHQTAEMQRFLSAQREERQKAQVRP